MIRVAILADTSLHARSLAEALAEDEQFDVVETRTLSSTSQLDSSGMVDVLVAVGVPIDRLRDQAVPVVVVTNESIEEIPLGPLIRAWLPMDSSPAEIAAAITAASNELLVMTQSQVNRWLKKTRETVPVDRRLMTEKMTPRELQVLRMLADGFGNKEIAANLGISDHTAKFHVAQILAKLGASSRAEAVAIGIRRALVAI